MNIDEILGYTREYLGRGLAWENSICLPQEELAQIKKSLGGINLAGGNALENWKENRTHNLFWIKPDTQELFEKHKSDPLARRCLEHFGWIRGENPVSIQYLLNDQGYRIDHDYDEEGIVFYGCSFTFGVGLEKKDTFSELVTKKLSLANFNFGIPGVGLDANVIHALFLLKHTIKRPKAIVVLNPPPRRWNYFHGFKIVTTSSNSLRKDISLEETGSMEFQCVTDDMNNLIQTSKNIIVLQNVAKELGVPFILVDFAHEFRREFKAYEHWRWAAARGDDSFDGISMARDLSHPGRETHKIWAEAITKVVEEKL
jgi:hypothetical protein